jgi:superfamily II DNA or RNA helicase
LGCFSTQEEAAKVRDSAAYYLKGAKAKLNFPDEVPKPLDEELIAKIKQPAFSETTLEEAADVHDHKIHGSGEWSLLSPMSSVDSWDSDAQGSSDDDNLDSPPDQPPIQLRPYQIEAVAKVREAFEEGGMSRLLIHMATGAGKTITFCSLAKDLNAKWVLEGRRDSRVLVLVHREELLDQTVQSFKRIWPEADVGVVKGKSDEYRAQVVVGTIQTCTGDRRLEKLQNETEGLGGFGICIIDEAHHAPARSYQCILEALGFLKDDSKLLVGVTATPFRQDKKLRLNDTFQHMAYEISAFRLIELGTLVKVNARRIMTDVKLSSNDSDEDFNSSQLEVLINSPERNALVVNSYIDYGQGRKAVAFCISIKHAQDLSQAFLDQGIKATSLHSKIKRDERKSILEAHRRGEIQVLTNVSILTEGYDDTSISCILMARPTKSPGLYAQCIGRGLRSHPGKEDCIIIDFTDRDHKLDRPSDLAVSVYDIIPALRPPFLPEERKSSEEWTMKIKPNSELDLRYGSRHMDPLPWIYVEELDAYFVELFKQEFQPSKGYQSFSWRDNAYIQVTRQSGDRWRAQYFKGDGSWKESEWCFFNGGALSEPVEANIGAEALVMIGACVERALTDEFGSNYSCPKGNGKATEKQLTALAKQGIVTSQLMTKREASGHFLRLMVLDKYGLRDRYGPVEFVPATGKQIDYLQVLISKAKGIGGDQPFVSEIEAKIVNGTLDKLEISSLIDTLKKVV